MARDMLESPEVEAKEVLPTIRTTPYTNQECYDIVAKHLRHMSRQSFGVYDGSKICLYHHEGLRCAFGVLIPDALYDPCFERQRVDGVLRSSTALGDLFCHVDLDLLLFLQSTHDLECNWLNKHKMYQELIEIGKTFKLNTGYAERIWRT